MSQQINSIYPDAELNPVSKTEYVQLSRKNKTLWTSGINKANDKFFPIKTYKYFEEDPLSNISSNFGTLLRTDTAIFQITIKPEWEGFNKKAKKVASQYSKWKYKRKGAVAFDVDLLNKIIAPISWFVTRFFQNQSAGGSFDSNAPGASGGDSYRIFNQAEQEAQKMVGEWAGQQQFMGNIVLLVSSDNKQEAEDGINSMRSATSIFTDEYANKLDNNQFLEDMFRPFFEWVHLMAFKYKLVGFFQKRSWYSIDELATIYHFPDINYNKSPIIRWLTYKKVAPPHNLPDPEDPLMLMDYVRDSKRNVITEDGSKLQVDKNGNLKKTDDKKFLLLDGWEVDIHTTWKNRGKTVDPGKQPKTELQQRSLGSIPLYNDGVLLGWNEYRNRKSPVYFMGKDRMRHHYIIGKSGTGKSVFIGSLARQDLWAGAGLGVIDPHGDLVEDIVSYCPKERAKDIIIFDPADYERPMGMNMLQVISTDPNLRAIEKDRAALDATSIFIKIFDEEIFGPRIQHYFRNGALTLMDDEEDGGTLIDVPRLFVDEAFMKYKVSKIRNPVVRNFWDHEYAQTGDREKQEMIPYFSSKFGPFITNTTIRNIIWQPKSAFNIREVMDSGKCLMVNLSKGKIWDLNAQLLGLIFVSKVNMAAMSRADTPESERVPFYFYVDEFQNFATDTFGEILSEARKYQLSLTMAHQYIAQIGWSDRKAGKPSIKDAVFGNAGTIQSFKVGAEDGEYLEKEYSPALSQADIIGIDKYTAYLKLNIKAAPTRPFDLRTIWDPNYQNRRAASIVKEYSRKMYGRKKEYVDMEIEARLGITKSEWENEKQANPKNQDPNENPTQNPNMDPNEPLWPPNTWGPNINNTPQWAY